MNKKLLGVIIASVLFTIGMVSYAMSGYLSTGQVGYCDYEDTQSFDFTYGGSSREHLIDNQDIKNIYVKAYCFKNRQVLGFVDRLKHYTNYVSASETITVDKDINKKLTVGTVSRLRDTNDEAVEVRGYSEYNVPHYVAVKSNKNFNTKSDIKVPKDKLKKLKKSNLSDYEKKVMKEEKELLYKHLNSTIKNKSIFKTIKFIPETDYDLYPELNKPFCDFVIDHVFVGDTIPLGAYVISNKVYFVSRSDNKVYEYKLEQDIKRAIDWEINK